MLILISPSKTLDLSNDSKDKNLVESTIPSFLEDSNKLIKILKKLSVKDISKLMSLSDKLSQLNFQRYQTFKTPFTNDNAKQAIFAFKGDVYDGLAADKLSTKEIEYAQRHLRILSGLYGLLRPLDLIQPYRLEMGIKLKNDSGKDLYKFWDDKITNNINILLSQNEVLVNLASNEYFKAVQKKSITNNIITPVFKEGKNGTYKIVMLYAKQARGMMANYIIKNQIKNPEDIKKFDYAGYKFNKSLSNKDEFVFTRNS